MDENPLSVREIQLVEQIGLMKGMLETYDKIILCMAVRLGGGAKIDHRELHYNSTNYILERNIRTDDLTHDITISARLK